MTVQLMLYTQERDGRTVKIQARPSRYLRLSHAQNALSNANGRLALLGLTLLSVCIAACAPPPTPIVIVVTATPQPTATPAPVTATPLPPTATATQFVTPMPRVSPTPTLGIGSTKVAPSDGTNMVYVPAGEFIMGTDEVQTDEKNKDVNPAHTVYLDAFWIDQFEVTNALYMKCVMSGVCQPPRGVRSEPGALYFGDPKYDLYPITFVAWDNANAYCSWVGKRLPTEAEWEKAARGTDGRSFPWGNTWDKTKLNTFDGNPTSSGTTPVNAYPSGASPYGAMDMAGNVWQWVADWYDEKYYATSPHDNPKGPPSGEYRVARGGSWFNARSMQRTSARGHLTPDTHLYVSSFRCAQ